MSLKKVFAAVIVLSFLLSPIKSFSQNMDNSNVPASIKSPRDLAQWLSSEFAYEMKMPDYLQTPEQTLEKRRGDCEDFAILSQDLLDRMGIESQVLIIKFTDLSVYHAICIFKYGEFYSFISNKEIFYTRGQTIEEAVEEKFPDWESISFINTDGKSEKVIVRKGCRPVGIGLNRSVSNAT